MILPELATLFGLALFVAALGGYFLKRNSARNQALNLLSELDFSDDKKSSKNKEPLVSERASKPKISFGKEFIIFPVVGCLAFGAFRFFGGANTQQLIFSALIGAGAGIMAARIKAERYLARAERRLERALPFALERVVMGVTAGLDIVPALKAASSNIEDLNPDPAEKLFHEIVNLCEKGITFNAAIEQVSSKIECPAVKHTFAHLSLAHKKGGELVRPLRELSDAISLFVQERQEEEIAKLPVKATLPLLVTFAGLVICLITIPLVQVVSVTSKVVDSSEK